VIAQTVTTEVELHRLHHKVQVKVDKTKVTNYNSVSLDKLMVHHFHLYFAADILMILLFKTVVFNTLFSL